MSSVPDSKVGKRAEHAQVSHKRQVARPHRLHATTTTTLRAHTNPLLKFHINFQSTYSITFQKLQFLLIIIAKHLQISFYFILEGINELSF